MTHRQRARRHDQTAIRRACEGFDGATDLAWVAHVAAVGPAQLLQPVPERRDADRRLRIVRGQVHKHADPTRPLALLRERR
jgi:hypothetical protein